MNNQDTRIAPIGAWTGMIGSLCMLCGAAIWGVTGADFDTAMVDDDIATYLTTARAGRTLLIANLSVWIVGIFLLGIAARMMSLLSSNAPVLSHLVRYNYGVAIPLVIASYMAWMAVVVRAVPMEAQVAGPLAEVVGWFGVMADWVATILVLGLGPMLIVRAGQGQWVPRWLHVWGHLCLIPGALTLLAMFAGGLHTYGFVIIPIGMGWMIGASVVLFKRAGAKQA
ncbi:MAG: hypothetical protein IPL52_09095 [Flavobacteriales bacterium]|nr:hypothetical protein [Flavobacteriales bacterium]